jgi:hypothetical protein
VQEILVARLPAPSAKKNYRKPRTPKTVVCQVCFERLPRLTTEHLRGHGLTFSSYSRIYTPATAPPSPLARRPGSAPLPALLDPDVRARIAERIHSDPDFIFRLADEVSDVLATGPIRDRTRMATGAVLEARVRMQGEALALLSRAYDRLKEPWRMDQSAETGGAISTRELLSIVSVLGAEVARGEDLVLRAGKLILEEQRSRIAAGLSSVDAADRFKGGDANIPLPPADSTPEARENMRIMLGMLAGGLQAANAAHRAPLQCDARVLEIDVSPEGPSGPPSCESDDRERAQDPPPVPPSCTPSRADALDV